MQIGEDTIMNDVIAVFPAASAVLEKLGFDTCCGGAETLGDSALNLGIPWETVMAALEPIIKKA